MKQYLYPIVFSLMSPLLHTQVRNYVFSQSIGTYTPITGGIVIAAATNNSGGSLDDQIIPISGFPFPFNFNGNNYNSCFLSTNGFITFGSFAPIPTLYNPISSNLGFDGVISAWANDLSSFHDINGRTGEIRAQVLGTAPNRVIVFQWKDFRPIWSGSLTDVYGFSFQIQLHETTNQVVIVYDQGSYAAGNAPYNGVAQVGLRGANNLDFNNRTNSSTQSINATYPGIVSSSAQSFDTGVTPPGMPQTGLMYTWTPSTCAPPSNLFASFFTSTSVTLSWTAPTTPPANGYEWEIRLSGLPFSGGGGLVVSGTSPSSATSQTISGLTPGTTYQAYLRANCGASVSNTIHTTFTTTCGLISNFPTLQDFSNFLPPCWSESTTGTLSTGPGSFSDSKWESDGFLNSSFIGAARINISEANTINWLVSPEYFINSSDLKVRFLAGATQKDATTPPTIPWESDDFVHFAISTPPYTSWTPLITFSNSLVPPSTGQSYLFDLSPYQGNHVRFAFLGIEGDDDGNADIDFFVDDLEVGANLSISEIRDLPRLIVYPNPVKDTLHFSSLHSIHKIWRFGINGQMLEKIDVEGQAIDTSHWSSGVYILQCDFEDGTSQWIKVLKQ